MVEIVSYSLVENRGIYYVSYRLKDTSGNVKQYMKSLKIKVERGNKRIAEKRMNEIITAIKEANTLQSNITYFHAYVEKWLERSKARIARTTYDGYMHMFEKHIKPYFSSYNYKLSDLKAMHLEQYYNTKISEGLSNNTVLKHHSLIKTVLKDALKNNYVRKNVAEDVSKVKKTAVQNDYYTQQELTQLLSAVKNTSIEVPVFLGVFFGLRRSEILGLKWSAIDFANRTLTINNSVTRQRDANGHYIDAESNVLKTEASCSTYYLNDQVCAYLAKRKRIQPPSLFVCVDEHGERLKADYITHKFSQILEKNHLRHIRFHDLRHSCISLLVSNNYNMKAVQNYARHSNFNTTANTYSHVQNTLKYEQLNTLTNALL